MFVRLVNFEDNQVQTDQTLDFSSIYGIFKFKVLEIDDEKIASAIHTMEDLAKRIPIGGMMRHENDVYYRNADVPGNPWIITTLWLAQYYISKAKKDEDFGKAKDIMKWVVEKAGPTGVLPEQLDPVTGAHLSATPLTWSHSEFVSTVINYLEKVEELGIFPQKEIKVET
jgi:GH15 family glucan-1,4-alpha-glucosidase